MSSRVTAPQEVIDAHQAFVDATGIPLVLNYARVYTWQVWLAHGLESEPRKGGWGPKQIKEVVKYIRAGIAKKKRQPEALKFAYLIERPGDFEETLAYARELWKRTQSKRGRNETPGQIVRHVDGKPVVMRIEADEAAAGPPARPISEVMDDFRASIGRPKIAESATASPAVAPVAALG